MSPSPDWSFYTPYSAQTSAAVTTLCFGLFLVGMSPILTGLNFIVAIYTMRAPGMNWYRLPLFIWGMYATSVIQVLSTPVIGITFILLAAERLFGVGFFDPAKGSGDGRLLVPCPGDPHHVRQLHQVPEKRPARPRQPLAGAHPGVDDQLAPAGGDLCQGALVPPARLDVWMKFVHRVLAALATVFLLLVSQRLVSYRGISKAVPLCALGLIGARPALACAALLTCEALAIASARLNSRVVLLLAASLSYVFCYTILLKPYTHWAAVWGAIPGAMPVLVGNAAVSPAPDSATLAFLLVILLCLYRGSDYRTLFRDSLAYLLALLAVIIIDLGR